MQNIVHKQLMEALVTLKPLTVMKMQELAGVSPIGEAEPVDAEQPEPEPEPEPQGIDPIEGTEPLNDLVERYSFAEILDKIAELYVKMDELSAARLAKKYAANFRKYLGPDDEK
jgi:hypothetical protein